MLRRIAAEPLTHFVVVALAIFAIYGFLNPSTGARDAIIVTAPKIEQLASLFAKTWQRPPTSLEMKGLIDDYVKEEIYYREALAFGLDKDDATIRRRLRLKMEYLADAENETLTPTDAQLAAWFKVNAGKFEIDASYALQQVFLSPQKRGDRVEADAAALLARLGASTPADPGALGDETQLPYDLPLAGKDEIGQIFGPEFADALDKAPVGRWSGPVQSSFGFHLVRVVEKKAGRIPELAEVRDLVAREWASEEKKRMQDQRFADLLNRYRVTIQLPADSPPPSGPRK